MIKSYLKSALRNIRKQRGYSVINILSLSVGIACCLLIARYIVFENSYDNYHENADRIFRINMDFWRDKPNTEERVYSFHVPKINAPLIKAIRKDMPQFESAVQLSIIGRTRKPLVSQNKKMFYIDNFIFIEQEVFEIFSIPFLYGTAEGALDEPGNVVITESIAKKYFGNEIPLGKILSIDDEHHPEHFKITGVVVDPPSNSHFKYDAMASFKTLEKTRDLSRWASWGFDGYVKLAPGINPKQAEMDLNKTYGAVLKEERITFRYFLEQIKKIHLNMGWTGETDSKYLFILSVVALIILLNAGINFINLMTARSSHRAKEIGMRKVVGAFRKQIIRQFLCESILISYLSLAGAFLLVRLALPALNSLTDRNFRFSDFFSPDLLIPAFALVFLLGLLSGFYPALFLSSFRPTAVLKGFDRSPGKGALLRKVLVVSQYTVSIILMISTLIIFQQTHYMKNRDMGFNKEQKLVFPIKNGENFASYKQEFLKLSSVLGATVSSGIPGRDISWNGGRLVGVEDNKEQILNHIWVDTNYYNEYEIEVIAGRSFDEKLQTDIGGPFVLNETAVKSLGFASPDDAIGQKMITYWGGDEKQEGPQPIIGVVRDFNYDGLQNEVKPLVMLYAPSYFRQMTLNVSLENISGTIKSVEMIWNKLFPGDVFQYLFLDDDFNRFYKNEERLMRIFSVFASLAVFISCLGLFGLAAFTAEKKTKEVGIRKVLGASVFSITSLLSKDFIRWVLFANVLAWPVAYFALSKWMENFAYRINIGLWSFLVPAVVSLMIAWLTVGYQSIKAAVANPVDSLKYE